MIDGLVDRLVTDMPGTPIGVGLTKPGRDLLPASLQLQLGLHQALQHQVSSQPTRPRPAGSLPCPLMRQVAVVATHIMGTAVTSQFP